MITIQNEQLSVAISDHGAELTGIRSCDTGIEYLWDADPAFWGKHAPVLFPIVGTLKDNSYLYKGKSYSMLRHGFARDKVFTLKEHTATDACFELTEDDETFARYPFLFKFQVRYRLEGNRLWNEYSVMNRGKELMYFSVGGHPAFRVPLEEGPEYRDYFLEFSEAETADRWPLSRNLVSTHPKPFLQKERIVPLSHDLFLEDAVILKNLRSSSVSLRSRASHHGVTLHFTGFPYLGIWAPPEAPFVCLEPWQGIADSLYHNQQISEKEGICVLEPGESWMRGWAVECW